MRWRGRDGPCGSHQEEARAEKWEISVSLTEEEEEEDDVGWLWRVGEVVLRVRAGVACWHGRGRDRGRDRGVDCTAAPPREAGFAAPRARGRCRSDGRILGWVCGMMDEAVPRGSDHRPSLSFGQRIALAGHMPACTFLAAADPPQGARGSRTVLAHLHRNPR